MIDHFEEALADILSQFRRSPRIRAFLQATAEQIQEVENRRFGLQESLDLRVARARILDFWGIRLSESRGTLNDADYRNILLTKLRALRSDGRIVELLEVAAQLWPDGIIRYSPAYPAGYQIDVETSSPSSTSYGDRIKRILDLMRPAGVEAVYVEGTTGMFRFDDSDNGLDQGLMGRTL